MQATQITDPGACREDALLSVRGWSSEISNAIRSTPLERITRSRIADRWVPGSSAMCGFICHIPALAHKPNIRLCWQVAHAGAAIRAGRCHIGGRLCAAHDAQPGAGRLRCLGGKRPWSRQLGFQGLGMPASHRVFLRAIMHAQDAVVLARALRGVMQEHASSSGATSLRTLPKAALAQALRDFERERTTRKLKISVRSNLMGAALQIPFGPVRIP